MVLVSLVSFVLHVGWDFVFFGGLVSLFLSGVFSFFGFASRPGFCFVVLVSSVSLVSLNLDYFAFKSCCGIDSGPFSKNSKTQGSFSDPQTCWVDVVDI